MYISGCALSPSSHYETPLYRLTIDQNSEWREGGRERERELLPCVSCPPVYAELLSTGLFERMSQTVDEEEHSIEMHLPYVAKARLIPGHVTIM